jgi:hypothetical protein|tara:strand:- start:91 stop:369 length:279 start_codon:yes stop_codon:yes gene_type:complete
MALKKSQKSLKNWTKQKWRTKSGKKSSETGERYLPEKAIKSLSASEYAAGTRRKRKAMKEGKTRAKYTEAEAKAFLRATNKKRKKKTKKKGG